MATPRIRKLTHADYARIPADGRRHEILGGEEFMTPARDVGHQRTSLKLEVILDQHVRRFGLGEVLHAPIDVVLSDEDVVQPDIVFVSSERSAHVGEKNIAGGPDLVVEILSPSTAAVDRGLKRELYARAGVREYWIIDRPARLVEVHVFGPTRHHHTHDEQGSFDSALFPGLVIRVSELF